MNTTYPADSAPVIAPEARTKVSPVRPAGLWRRKSTIIAGLCVSAILLHLALRFGYDSTPGTYQLPLLATLALGGPPLLYDLLRKLLRRKYGSVWLGGISIVTSIVLGEYLAGSIIVSMLSGGEALESYALQSASSVLALLANRMPGIAHRKRATEILDVSLDEIAVGDTVAIFPHEICPADGVVIEGHGVMDESYLTGEPFQMSKTRGRLVAGGVARADQLPSAAGGLECVVAIDDRYAAAYRFRHASRKDSLSSVSHLGPKHRFARVVIVSGDRESEVRYLASQVGITHIHAQQSPEEKLAIVRKETAAAKTLYVGDGINDAPSMMAATVGMATGQNRDVPAEVDIRSLGPVEPSERRDRPGRHRCFGGT